jgi:hypothetical protein
MPGMGVSLWGVNALYGTYGVYANGYYQKYEPKARAETPKGPVDSLRPGQGVSAKAGAYVYTVIVDWDSLSG